MMSSGSQARLTGECRFLTGPAWIVHVVIPAKAGIHPLIPEEWIPAFAGTKGDSPMTTKTNDTDAIITEPVEKRSPRDLDRLPEKDDWEFQDSSSPEIMAQLDVVADKHDGRAYRHLIGQTDWSKASAELLDHAIGIAIRFGDMRRGRALTELGLRRFPGHKPFARASLLFHPRPSKVVSTPWRPPKNWFKDSIEWIRQHIDEYEVGHWLAVRPGERVADAPTRDELDKKLAMSGEDGKPSLIYKVIP